MADPPFRVRLEPGDLSRNMDKAARGSDQGMRKLVARVLAIALSEIVGGTPVGATNVLRGGYNTEGPRRSRAKGRWRGAVINPALYHDIREEGRKAGRAPPSVALEDWVGTKLGVPLDQRPSVAFLVARKIGREGYEGAHMVSKGVARTRRRIRPELRRLNRTVSRSLR